MTLGHQRLVHRYTVYTTYSLRGMSSHSPTFNCYIVRSMGVYRAPFIPHQNNRDRLIGPRKMFPVPHRRLEHDRAYDVDVLRPSTYRRAATSVSSFRQGRLLSSNSQKPARLAMAILARVTEWPGTTHLPRICGVSSADGILTSTVCGCFARYARIGSRQVVFPLMCSSCRLILRLRFAHVVVLALIYFLGRSTKSRIT